MPVHVWSRRNDKPCLWARIHSELSADREWIYFIFKTNNISRKPQVINHKWVNAGDVVPQVRGEKWRKNIWNDLAICLIPFQSNSFITTHYYMTHFLINLQPSKLLLFFIFSSLIPYIILSFRKRHDWFPSLFQSFFEKVRFFVCVSSRKRLKDS